MCFPGTTTLAAAAPRVFFCGWRPPASAPLARTRRHDPRWNRPREAESPGTWPQKHRWIVTNMGIYVELYIYICGFRWIYDMELFGL